MINRNNTYHLEKYHGPGSRHTCPSCGRKRCFTYYVDDAGRVLDKICGKCDHESSCGYHYTPKQFFHDHESESVDYIRRLKTSVNIKAEKKPLYPVYTMLPFIWVQRFKGRKNGLTDYLHQYFDDYDVSRVVDDYYIGGTRREETVFWQIDIHGTARTAKIIAYQANGHRYKDGIHNPNWVHSKLLGSHRIPYGFELHQCMFGEHLIAEYPYRTIFLVEAEKTAVICAMVIPSVTWVSCGGKSMISAERVKSLCGRRIILIPDYDGIAYWSQHAAEVFGRLKINAEVLVSVYDGASGAQRAKGCDMADMIMDALDSDGPHSDIIRHLNEIICEKIK